jgi:hypothetical protein
MSRARRRALVFAATAMILGALIAAALVNRGPAPLPARPPAQRPVLLLLTSLPLLFNEDFALSGGGSAAVERLQTRYKIVPISVTDAAELGKGGLLLMAHPLAQPAEDLVALDEWVRRGGRVLLFADPMLQWPSKRQLGDPLRPPPMFMDTGLLAHWGLRLDAPDERGPAVRRLDGFDVLTLSPGELAGTCDISSDRLVARCRIGKGKATVIADADLLNARELGRGAAHNLDAVIAELANLERK